MPYFCAPVCTGMSLFPCAMSLVTDYRYLVSAIKAKYLFCSAVLQFDNLLIVVGYLILY